MRQLHCACREVENWLTKFAKLTSVHKHLYPFFWPLLAITKTLWGIRAYYQGDILQVEVAVLGLFSSYWSFWIRRSQSDQTVFAVSVSTVSTLAFDSTCACGAIKIMAKNYVTLSRLMMILTVGYVTWSDIHETWRLQFCAFMHLIRREVPLQMALALLRLHKCYNIWRLMRHALVSYV